MARSLDDLKSKCALDVDGDVVGRVSDGADALDHCGRASLRMRHRAYYKPDQAPSS